MDTLHQPPDSLPDPQAATPYFRRELALAADRRGLPPEPWAA